MLDQMQIETFKNTLQRKCNGHAYTSIEFSHSFKKLYSAIEINYSDALRMGLQPNGQANNWKISN